MKKYLLISFLFVGFFFNAQQIEQFSMYMENNFLINPAEAGTEDFVDVKMGYRNQWVGLDGAPRTFFVSAHTPLGKKPDEFEDVTPLPFHGAGVAIIGDQIGPFSRTMIKASYAYHLPLGTDFVLSMGVHAGIQQFQLDFSDLRLSNGDLATSALVPEATPQSLSPDLSFGVWGYASNYYFGLASFQLIPSRLRVTEGTNGAEGGRLSIHHWATAGYKIPLGSSGDFNLVPSFVLKFEHSAPLQFDINTKLRYKDRGWIGTSYRYQESVVGIVGITLKKLVDIAYSYDFNISKFQSVNRGSHEVLVGLRLPYHEIAPPPAQFW